MKNDRPSTNSLPRRHGLVPVAVLVVTLAACQNFEGGRHVTGPLILERQGSFFVGGETLFSDGLLGAPIPMFPQLETEGSIRVNQMYVQYQLAVGSNRHVPVVMLHGGTMTGKQYEETPDGRMGWYEYFARQHRPVYVADAVFRGRSGFDQTAINRVARGLAQPSDLPNILRVGEEFSWEAFRFGPTRSQVPYTDGQFPVEAADEFFLQGVPDFNAAVAFLDAPDPTVPALGLLARKLGGAILMAHSASAFFPQRAALVDPTSIRGIISLEAVCNNSLTMKQIATLAKIPTLVVFGDHIEDTARWANFFSLCQEFVRQVNSAGGDVTLLHLPRAGLKGNSHLFMQDKNNLEVADLLLKWIDEHVEARKRP